MEILLLIVGLVLFVALVVVHEFGHFIMARRNGVEVEEFGVGFPPKAMTIGRDKRGTEYTLNWLPLGGFVRLKGEHDSDTDKGSFGAASFAAKTKIMLAGVFMNLVTAWIMFSFLALVGIPKLPLPGGSEQFTVKSDTKVVSNRVMVGYIEKGGPADIAGLRTGDQIVSLGPVSNPDKYKLSSYSKLRDTVKKLLVEGNSKIEFSLQNGMGAQIEPRTLAEIQGIENCYELNLSDNCPERKGYLGVQPYDYTVQRSTWSAPIVGAGLIKQYSELTYKALGSSVANLFKGHAKEAGENVSGPIGIFVVLKDGASFGITYILLIIALLSLTLAIMNTLPIPALDGGKLAVMLLFRLLKKPLTPRLEERIHGSGFMLLMLLFVVITVVDVKRFF